MKKAGLLIAPAFACACASTAPVYDPIIPFDTDGAAIERLTVAGDALPEKAVGLDLPTDYSYISSSMSNPYLYGPAVSTGAAAAGGLIAMLIIAGVDATIDASRNSKINEFLDAQGFDAKAAFYDRLTANLGGRGYDIALLDAGAAHSGAGAHLDVDISHYGYQIVSGGWAPSVVAKVTLAAGEGGAVLLKDSVATGSPGGGYYAGPVVGGDAIILPYNPNHIFKDVNGIVDGDPARGVEALRSSLEAVADKVADMVRSTVLEQRMADAARAEAEAKAAAIAAAETQLTAAVDAQ